MKEKRVYIVFPRKSLREESMMYMTHAKEERKYVKDSSERILIYFFSDAAWMASMYFFFFCLKENRVILPIYKHQQLTQWKEVCICIFGYILDESNQKVQDKLVIR